VSNPTVGLGSGIRIHLMGLKEDLITEFRSTMLTKLGDSETAIRQYIDSFDSHTAVKEELDTIMRSNIRHMVSNKVRELVEKRVEKAVNAVIEENLASILDRLNSVSRL